MESRLSWDNTSLESFLISKKYIRNGNEKENWKFVWLRIRIKSMFNWRTHPGCVKVNLARSKWRCWDCFLTAQIWIRSSNPISPNGHKAKIRMGVSHGSKMALPVFSLPYGFSNNGTN